MINNLNGCLWKNKARIRVLIAFISLLLIFSVYTILCEITGTGIAFSADSDTTGRSEYTLSTLADLADPLFYGMPGAEINSVTSSDETVAKVWYDIAKETFTVEPLKEGETDITINGFHETTTVHLTVTQKFMDSYGITTVTRKEFTFDDLEDFWNFSYYSDEKYSTSFIIKDNSILKVVSESSGYGNYNAELIPLKAGETYLVINSYHYDGAGDEISTQIYRITVTQEYCDELLASQITIDEDSLVYGTENIIVKLRETRFPEYTLSGTVTVSTADKEYEKSFSGKISPTNYGYGTLGDESLVVEVPVDIIDAGTEVNITVDTGSNNYVYTGAIAQYSLQGKAIKENIVGESFVYSGRENEISVDIKHGRYIRKEVSDVMVDYSEWNTLIKDKDFTIEYDDNVNAGNATATITGIGNYCDVITHSFVIDPLEITLENASLESTKYTYTGEAIEPVPEIIADDLTLANGKDFELTYKNNVEPGIATITVNCKGNYTGSFNMTFQIGEKDPEEQTDPTDPTNPTDPTDPGEQTDPTDPTNPTDPTDPGEQTEPIDPSDPTDPTDPGEPTEPTHPSDPADPVTPDEPPIQEPEEETEPITIAKSRTIMCVGCTLGLRIEENIEDGVTWKSSDPSIAEVTQSGTVKALKEGKVTITASYKGSTSKCDVGIKDYAYVGKSDNDFVHNQYPYSTTQTVRVYAYTDAMGNDIVLTLIDYKIESYWQQVGFHNLTTGQTLYDGTIDKYFNFLMQIKSGREQLKVADANVEYAKAKLGMQTGNCRYYDPNKKDEEKEETKQEEPEPVKETKPSVESAPSTETKPSEESTPSKETKPSVEPAPSKETKPSEETKEDNTNKVDPVKQMGSDGTALGKGASAAAANKAITKAKGDKDLKGSVFNKLRVEQSKATKTSVTIKWKKVKGAKKYVIYAGKSGKNYKVKKVATLKSTKTKYTLKKFNKKKLTKGTYYKFAVVALNSKGKVITSSKFAHVATLGKNKKSNPATVTVSDKVKKNKISLKVKKTFKLKGAYAASAKKFKIRKVLPMRYESTNPKVAKVSSKGVITAKKKGTCYIFAYAQNGMYKRIKVTVKK